MDDDAFAMLAEFENGAMGTLEATRMAAGRKNANVIEINGEFGSIRWNLERLNELEVYDAEHDSGFQSILVTEREHPFMEHWWPPGHILGWEHTFVHEMDHLLREIVS